MSYEIVYERQFIKTSDGLIIPFVLIGSNNCYEPVCNGYKRRCRSWSTIFVHSNELIAMRPADLLQRAYSYTGGPYQEHFKRFGKWVNDAGLIRFCKNGIKQAKAIEEINQLQFMRGYISVWYPDETSLSDETYFPKHSIEDEMYICSSGDLDQFLAHAKERLQRRGDESIHIGIRCPY